LRGGQFAICLALIENGDVKVGVLGCPNLPISLLDPVSERGCIFIAAKDQGAYMVSLFICLFLICSTQPLAA